MQRSGKSTAGFSLSSMGWYDGQKTMDVSSKKGLRCLLREGKASIYRGCCWFFVLCPACKCNFWSGTIRWVMIWYGGKIFKGWLFEAPIQGLKNFHHQITEAGGKKKQHLSLPQQINTIRNEGEYDSCWRHPKQSIETPGQQSAPLGPTSLTNQCTRSLAHES